MKNNFLVVIARVLFGLLAFFELLNWAGILHFSLDFTWLGLLLTSVIVWLMLELLMGRVRRFAPRFQFGIGMILAFGAVLADALGDMLHLYTHYVWYDQFLHFAGALAAGVLVFATIYALANSPKYSKLNASFGWVAFIAFCATVFLGVVYELEEYLEDVLTNSNRFGDAHDTGNDLLLDVSGALLAILLFWVYFTVRKHLKERR